MWRSATTPVERRCERRSCEVRGGSWDVVDVKDDGIGMVVEVLDCERVGGAVMLLT